MFKTAGLEDFGWQLGEMYQEIDRLEEQKEEYVGLVDAYTRGEISPDRMESAVYDMARTMDNLEDERRDAESIYRRAVGAFETGRSDVPDRTRGINQEMAEKLVEEGFEILTSPSGARYAESATENELAYQAFVESYGTPEFIDDDLTRGEQLNQIITQMSERIDSIEDEAKDYQAQFLYDNLDLTISGAYLDIQEGYVEAAFDQELERQKAEEIRKNPRDIYIGGFESEEGIESLEEAREEVRRKTPRGKLENEGPSEEEIEENNRKIKEKREEIENREDRGIY